MADLQEKVKMITLELGIADVNHGQPELIHLKCY
jgi:hypothetical protein